MQVMIDSTSTAIKREDGGPGRSLYNDFQMHTSLLVAYQSCPDKICSSFLVPKCHGFIQGTYEGWGTTNLLKRFPEGYSPCNILITQRIPPVLRDARHMLIDKYCPPSLTDNIKADINNSDCIIRPYLGRRRLVQRESRLRVFSLRNYPLYLDQMADLELDVLAYSTAMARTLAFMHWSARIDANDMEFVLAPAADGAAPQFVSPHLGEHNLWILDFDCCRYMAMDEEGVEQAAKAFLRNDPFYPQPGKDVAGSPQLWEHFRAAFLEASVVVMAEAGPGIPKDLPESLMRAIERLAQH